MVINYTRCPTIQLRKKRTLQHNMYPLFDIVILCRREEMVFFWGGGGVNEMMIDAELGAFGLVTCDYIRLSF